MGVESLPVHKVFLAAHAIDEEGDTVDASLELARMKHRFARMARQVILLADSSKWHGHGEAKALPLSEVDVIVTDEGLATEDRRRIEDLGIKPITA